MKQDALIVFNLQNKFVDENNNNKIRIKAINDILLPHYDLIIFIKKEDPKEVIIPDYDFHPDLDFSKCKKDFYIFRNIENDYNIFHINELKDFLDEREVTLIHFCGISIDEDIEKNSEEADKLGYVWCIT